MRTPSFWYRPAGLLAWMLAPAGWVYAAATARRFARTRPHVCRVPVVCVGNLVAGGAGKTPVAIALAEALIARGNRPCFLSRGYGGTEAGPHRVDPARDSASRVGDEPLLLAARAPCVIARDRLAGCALACDLGCDVVVMDDGFQNPAIAKDLSLVVIDGEAGFGNGYPIPAGPLRENVDRGLARADAVAVVGTDRAGVSGRVGRLPILSAHIEPGPDIERLAGKRVFAFAGIGQPEKVFATLRRSGAQVVGTASFPDHHPYTLAEIERLITAARSADAIPVTTEKDAVRVPQPLRALVAVAAIRCVWDDPGALHRLLDRLLPRSSHE